MDKEIQNLTWKCLPKEARDFIREMYKTADQEYKFHKGKRYALEMTYGKSNLESDTEPEEMLMVERKKVIEKCNEITEDYATSGSRWCSGYINALNDFFGNKCLPDNPIPSDSTELKSKQKFKVGDKVIIGEVANQSIRGKIGVVERLPTDNYPLYAIRLESGLYTDLTENYLTPYTEESRNLSQNIANCDKSEDNQLKDNMEEKELDLTQLLKGCEGEEFYLLDCGNATLDGIQTNNSRGDSIKFLSLRSTNFDSGSIIINPNGKRKAYGSVILYPSRALYEKYPLDAKKAWDEWASERKPKRWRANSEEPNFYYLNCLFQVNNNIDSGNPSNDKLYKCGNYFRTEELAQQAAEAVRETLERFHKDHTEQ
ncbi:MAG: nitrile hydratase subunit beta [Muribaculaceae bacterium]|nr:nitrile hydratase subunit beta [Muribaculaceae bacterium]